eukprot:355390-Chlamydomonas_euryale.AAC.4
MAADTSIERVRAASDSSSDGGCVAQLHAAHVGSCYMTHAEHGVLLQKTSRQVNSFSIAFLPNAHAHCSEPAPMHNVLAFERSDVACRHVQIDGEVRDKILCMIEDYAKVLPQKEFRDTYEMLLVRVGPQTCTCKGRAGTGTGDGQEQGQGTCGSPNVHMQGTGRNRDRVHVGPQTCTCKGANELCCTHWQHDPDAGARHHFSLPTGFPLCRCHPLAVLHSWAPLRCMTRVHVLLCEQEHGVDFPARSPDEQPPILSPPPAYSTPPMVPLGSVAPLPPVAVGSAGTDPFAGMSEEDRAAVQAAMAEMDAEARAVRESAREARRSGAAVAPGQAGAVTAPGAPGRKAGVGPPGAPAAVPPAQAAAAAALVAPATRGVELPQDADEAVAAVSTARSLLEEMLSTGTDPREAFVADLAEQCVQMKR